MIVISKKEAKREPLFKMVFDTLRSNHKVAAHTSEILEKNKHISGFCEKGRHFCVLPGKSPLFLHYDVHTWLSGKKFIVQIVSVGFYESFLEYEGARVVGLNLQKIRTDFFN